MSIESLLNMTIFTATKKKTNSENSIVNKSTSEQSETDEYQIDQLVKCYVGVFSGRSNHPYKIDDLFNGKLDAIFKSSKEGDNKPSLRFTSQYIIFSLNSQRSKALAAKHTALRGHGSKTTYLLEMGYTEDEVKVLAAQGKFSKAVLGAVDANELSDELIFHTKTNTQYLKNPNFNPDLIQEYANGDQLKATSR